MPEVLLFVGTIKYTPAALFIEKNLWQERYLPPHNVN